MAARDDIRIGSFSFVPGDASSEARSIPRFEDLWRSVTSGAAFDEMGCRDFRRLTAPVEQYVADCVRQTLDTHGVGPEEVDHVVFSTMDSSLRLVRPDFVARTLDTAGMVHSVPTMLSYRQCCSSLAALAYAWELFADPAVTNVLVVAFDFSAGDEDRIRSYALFGDAVTACMVSRRPGGRFRLAGSAAGTDPHGLMGADSFDSRQQLAQRVLDAAFDRAGIAAADIERVFPCNLFKPLALFNAAMVGIAPSRLHFDTTLARFGHCGNADWMMNLLDFEQSGGFADGGAHLALASGPGFFACSVLVALDSVCR